MEVQEKSWVDVYGHPKKRELVGQIYFPYKGYKLDVNDEEVIDSLASKYIVFLFLRHSINLRFEGHCDRRGDFSNNYRLGIRRAKAVQDYFDKKLKSPGKYFSSSVVSFGERGATIGSEMELDRRVDIISSFVPKRPPIQMPTIYIEGKIATVERPIQFVDIEFITPEQSWHVLIYEKIVPIEESLCFPGNMHEVNIKVHSIFPRCVVRRCTIGWRKPETPDSMKTAATAILNLLNEVVLDIDERIDFTGKESSIFEPRNVVFKSWEEFERKNAKSALEFLVYKGKDF